MKKANHVRVIRAQHYKRSFMGKDNGSVLAGRSDTDDSGIFAVDSSAGPVDFIEFRKSGYQIGLVKFLHYQHSKTNNIIIK